MRQTLIQWQTTVKRPEGWCIAIAGLKRSGWLTYDHGATYNEKEAMVFRTKEEAAAYMNGLIGKNNTYYHYAMLIPRNPDEMKWNNGLPTVMGY